MRSTILILALSIIACSGRSPPPPTPATAARANTKVTRARLEAAGPQSSGSAVEYSYDPGGNLTGIRVAGPVAISTDRSTRLAPGGQLTLTASGGNGIYTWSVAANGSGGSITTAGLYTAGGQGGVTDTVKVTDSSRAWANATITVTRAAGTPTYASVTSTSLSIEWTAADDAVSYRLERAPDASGAPGSWAQIASGVTALTYADSGLTANTAYWYRVCDTKAAGDGSCSAASKVVTLANAPGTPTFSNVGQLTVTVNWTAPTGGAASYSVERAPDASGTPGTWAQITSGVTGLAYADSGLTASMVYWYRVRASNALGLNGACSTAASVSTAPNLPGGPGTPTYTSIATTTLSVSWTGATGAVSFKVARAPDASGSPGTWAQIASGVTALSYSSSGLTANTAYWYRVRGTNTAGDGPYSAASKTMTLPNASGTPNFGSVTQQTLTVNWTAPTRGAATYKVERTNSSSGSWTQIAAGLTARSYGDSGLTSKTKYWYRVRATNALGLDGAYSSTASVTTQ